MLKIFQLIKSILVRSLEFLVIILVAVLTLDVVWQVFTRFILRNPSTWTDELATMLLIWVSLLGASVGFQRKSHLGVDFFVSKLSPRYRNIVEILAYLLISFFAGGILIFGGAKIVHLTLQYKQTSPALELPMGYVYLALPISGFFILIFSLETVIEKIYFLFTPKKHAES